VHTGVWWEILSERDQLGKTGVDGIIKKMDFQKVGNGDMDWIEWLMIETGGGHL
jgi:hypothetical protein